MMRSLLVLGLVAALLTSPALAARSEWASADTSRLRLFLIETPDGKLAGGVEIELDPGWYSYWRVPGDVGVAPRFDFTASENVKSVEVLYPAPERHRDEVGLSLIYRDHITFPLAVVPNEPGKPVTLRLDAFYGACKEVCIPVQAQTDVTWQPDESPDLVARIAIERYRSLVPVQAEPGTFEIKAVRQEADALLIDVLAPDGVPLDLFVAGPEDWFLGQPEFLDRKGPVARFSLSLEGVPPDAALAGATFRFVAVSGGRAIEEVMAVPVEALDR